MASEVSPVITNLAISKEASYRAPTTIDESHWQMLNTPAVVVENLIDSGTRGIDNRTAANLPNTRMSGRWGQSNISFWLRGSEDLDSIAPREADQIFRASGMRYIPTAKPKTWIYEPWHNDFQSLAAEFAGNNQIIKMEGTLVSSWQLTALDAGIAQISALLSGVISNRTSGPSPVVDTAPVNIMPVKFDGKGVPKNSVIKQGATLFNPIVRGMSLSFTREITTRLDGNQQNVVAGFSLGRYGSPRLTIQVEATSLDAFNPHLCRASALPCLITQSFQTGSTWWYIVSEQARLQTIEYQEIGGILYWNLGFDLLNRGIAQSPFWIMCSDITPTD